jgi:hypothetical protein
MLRAYRKSGGTFPCWPKNICFEPNGDWIPDFLSEPGYLGEFRGTFEPNWDSAVAAMKAHSPNMRDKLHIAGYWANLLVCTPTWTRVAIQSSNQRIMHTVRAHNILSARIGKPDEKVSEAIRALERGEIVVETESDYVRAQSVHSIMQFAWGLYNAEWDVFENDTAVDFVTSDNPASCVDMGDVWFGMPPFTRFLPITPKLCIMCDLTRMPELRGSKPDFTQEPKGTIRGGLIDLNTVKKINVWIAKNAEDLVLCDGENDYVQELTKTYSKFRVENDSALFEHGRGYIVSNRTRIIKRKDGPVETAAA